MPEFPECDMSFFGRVSVDDDRRILPHIVSAIVSQTAFVVSGYMDVYPVTAVRVQVAYAI